MNRRKVRLDTNKMKYDGSSFVVQYTEKQLKDKFRKLLRSLRRDDDYRNKK